MIAADVSLRCACQVRTSKLVAPEEDNVVMSVAPPSPDLDDASSAPAACNPVADSEDKSSRCEEDAVVIVKLVRELWLAEGSNMNGDSIARDDKQIVAQQDPRTAGGEEESHGSGSLPGQRAPPHGCASGGPSDRKCPICLEPISSMRGVVTKCGHWMHIG